MHPITPLSRSMMLEQLVLSQITKSFGDVLAVDGVSLTVGRGEFLSLLGPSGSGKTTLLNMIAGFVTPCSGEIHLEGERITQTPPHRRNIGMVFQDYALFPHLTVFENVAFPLRMRKIFPETISEQVTHILRSVKMEGMEKRRPDQLSGGQKQRVALARALVFKPRVLLMDEPLGALDEKLRKHMRLEIKQLQRAFDVTVVFVTHNQDEALAMSDRIAVLNRGRVVQVDTPEGIYESPRDYFVADFVGNANFLNARIEAVSGNTARLHTADGLFVTSWSNNGCSVGQQTTVMIRPEKIHLDTDMKMSSHQVDNVLPGRIVDATYEGDVGFCLVALSDRTTVTVKTTGAFLRGGATIGQDVLVYWKCQDSMLLAPSTPPRGDHDGNTSNDDPA